MSTRRRTYGLLSLLGGNMKFLANVNVNYDEVNDLEFSPSSTGSIFAIVRCSMTTNSLNEFINCVEGIHYLPTEDNALDKFVYYAVSDKLQWYYSNTSLLHTLDASRGTVTSEYGVYDRPAGSIEVTSDIEMMIFECEIAE